MCGINGITANNRALVEHMNEATKHRGPDGSRVWEGEGITLGHTRLAIIDLSDDGAQPKQSHDERYTIVFNGEIYNYRELRDELKAEGCRFTTESDTEVLLTAWERWGRSMFPRLRGIFAFGIWDKNTHTLTLARDHMGVKPLYYTKVGGALLFSSELRALLPHMDKRRLNMSGVAFYLSMEYVPGPMTLVEGVEKLRPGHLLTYKEGNIEVNRYFIPEVHEKPITYTDIYSTIDTAVKRQLVSDRPVGAYLSGGFDSSIVVHHMCKHEALTRTYSVAYEAVQGQEDGTRKFNDDATLAEKTAHAYATKHTTYTITLGEIRSQIESIIATEGEPVANPTAITQYLLSDYVRNDGTVVVLGGDGGDELFGGYTRHRIATTAYLYQQLPRILQKMGGLIHPRLGKLMTPFGTPFHRAVLIKDGREIQPFLAQELKGSSVIDSYFDAEYAQVASENSHPLDSFMRIDRETWLPDECFVRSDNMSMAHGIELRVPFVDLDVVTLADSISPWRKTLPHEGKRIIRETYRKHLPPHLYGEPKRGWLSPAAKWFRDPVLGAFAREVYSSNYYSGLDGLFSWEHVQETLTSHIEGRRYSLYPLWNILVLQVWAKANDVTA